MFARLFAREKPTVEPAASGRPPYLTLSSRQLRHCAWSERAAAELAGQIAGLLRDYPHFVVVRGSASDDNGAFTTRMCKLIANLGKAPAGDVKADFSRVYVEPPASKDDWRIGTRYSRTNQELGLHTDSTFEARPHELVAFQFVKVDPVGGDSLMVPVEDVLAALDDDVKRKLAEAHFPFATNVFPILWQSNGKPNMRYYRAQIDFAREKNGAKVSKADLAALDALDAVLARDDIRFQFHAEPGDTVFMHNTKILHGRTSFGETSDRLMYRLRLHADSLS